MKYSNILSSQLEKITWVTKRVSIKEPNGRVVFEDEIEVPSTWSDTAASVFSHKYCKRIPGKVHEKSVKDVVKRIVDKIGSTKYKDGYFPTKEDWNNFKNELTAILTLQYAAFNSPVWFNCGIDSYGIKGERSGNYTWDIEDGGPIEVEDIHESPQLSACFIQGIEDDLNDIAAAVQREMKVFKYGSGSGTNFSKLRGKGEPLSGGGESSGVISFLKILDVSAGAIKSGGITRRSAKMDILDIDHPDIEEFILWKKHEEDKAREIKQKTGWQKHEVAELLTGQNSNNSVMLTDEFMNAYMADENWELKNRVNGGTNKTVKARHLMDLIADAIWSCGDPGVAFYNNINNHNPLKEKFNASNPCCEFVFLNDSACNLASLNLVKCLPNGLQDDFEIFNHVARIMLVAQDAIIDLASYPTREICKNSHWYRPVGLGYTNLGAFLMANGIPYDLNDGAKITAKVTSRLSIAAYKASMEIDRDLRGMNGLLRHGAEHLGFDVKRHCEIVEKCSKAAKRHGLQEESLEFKRISEAIVGGANLRNSQLTLLAPTGTVSLIMDCATTGIEPDFALVKHKTLSDGGAIKIINTEVVSALRKLKYGENEIQNILQHIKEHNTIIDAPHVDCKHYNVFRCASGVDERDTIHYSDHLRVVAAATSFLSGSISKTINMPESTTKQQIKNAIESAWHMGLKSISIFRNNSKISQPLNREVKKGNQTSNRRRLPKKRFGFTQEVRISGQKLYLRTGEYDDGTLGEIFIDMHKSGAAFRTLMNCFAMSVSIALQYGVPLEKLVECFMYTKFEPQGFCDHSKIRNVTSPIDYIFKLLNLEYLEQKGKEQKSQQQKKTSSHNTPICPICGNWTVRSGRCFLCISCGQSTGCE